MIYVLPSLDQGFYLGRKWEIMSSRSVAASAVVISSVHVVLSSLARSVLNSLVTIRSAPQACLLMAVMTPSIFK